MKLLTYSCGLLLLLTTTTALSEHNKQDNPVCGILQIDVTNNTNARASLSGDPETQRLHGYIYRRGLVRIPRTHSTVWSLSEHPFSGPRGTIVYQWTGEQGNREKCIIDYHQSYCGYLRAGDNTTTVRGNCSVYNDLTKPSLYWHLKGESQVTLGDY